MNKSHPPALGRVILAHGAGSSRTHPHLLRLAALLQTAGNLVSTFDFPYRLNGRQLPDKMPTLLSAMSQQIEVSQLSTLQLPLFLAGHSMGGRVALRIAGNALSDRNENSPPPAAPRPPISGVILFSYPLQAANGKGELRLDGFAQCQALGIPVLMLSGERDALAPQDLQNQHLQSYTHLQRVILPGLDHAWSAKVKGPQPEETDALVVQSLKEWQAKVLAS